MSRTCPAVLTIAGSDSGGGAGIQADLHTFAACGVWGASAITALTAQNTLGVLATHTVPAPFVRAQIDAVMQDIHPTVWKTGMLATTDIIETVAHAAAEYAIPHLVLDPVMVATSGDALLEEDAHHALIHRLLPRATVITPNRAEAEALTGLLITSLDEMRAAARILHGIGGAAVILTGGHIEDPEWRGHAVDLFFDGTDMYLLAAERITTTNTHGTGCTFSAALAASLAQGLPLLTAAQYAKTFITHALRAAADYQLGRGHGPAGHFLLAQSAPLDPSLVRVVRLGW